MGFKKFGTSDDQTATVEERDQQGLSKTAIKRIEEEPDHDGWDNEGGNGSHRRDE